VKGRCISDTTTDDKGKTILRTDNNGNTVWTALVTAGAGTSFDENTCSCVATASTDDTSSTVASADDSSNDSEDTCVPGISEKNDGLGCDSPLQHLTKTECEAGVTIGEKYFDFGLAFSNTGSFPAKCFKFGEKGREKVYWNEKDESNHWTNTYMGVCKQTCP